MWMYGDNIILIMSNCMIDKKKHLYKLGLLCWNLSKFSPIKPFCSLGFFLTLNFKLVIQYIII